MNHVKLIESSLEYIKCVDKEHDTNDFIKRFGHVQSTATSNSPSPSSSPSKSKLKPKAKRANTQPIINTNIDATNLRQTPGGVLISKQILMVILK